MVAVEHISKTSNLIVGLGKTGLSCADYLARNGESFAVADSRVLPPGLNSLQKNHVKTETYLGEFDEQVLSRYSRLWLSPGVALSEPAIQAAIQSGIEVVSDVEIFAQQAKAPVLAITGSNGKSTVTTLLAEMLKAAGHQVLAGGNLGEPVLDLLKQPVPDYYVLELSSFQLETVSSLQLLVASILNVSPDHMDRYPDFKTYCSSKARIYRHAEVAVYNRDDPASQECMNQSKSRVSFGADVPVSGQFGFIEDNHDLFLAYGQERLIAASELRIQGKHNYLNALAALAMGQAAGLTRTSMLDALRKYQGLEHRSEWVAEKNSVVWINDSKATNLGATVAALQGMDRPVVLIAGGLGKGADFNQLRNGVAEHARAIVLIGQDAEKIASAIHGLVPVEYAKDMSDAVQKAGKLAQSGDAVLFSPACASFDMFTDYAHRGDVFKSTVLESLT